MTDDKQKTATPTTDPQPQAERVPAPAEERKLTVEDVEADQAEAVKGGGLTFNGQVCG